MTEVLRVDARQPDPRTVSRAAACLRRGGLVAFPTETVYGLGANALDRSAVRRVFEAKGRPSTDPLIVHVEGFDQAVPLTTEAPGVARELADRFWPGPLTLVMRRSPVVPDEVTAGLDTVAVRAPAHPVARALLAAACVPVAAPSANLFSRPSPTTAAHVLADLGGRVDLVLDGGATAVGIESTVVDLTASPPVVLRPGAIGLEVLEVMLPGVRFGAPAGTPEGGSMASPGLLPQHYAPRTPLTLFQGDATRSRQALLAAAGDALADGRRVGILLTSEDAEALRHLPIVIGELGSKRDAALVATRLYSVLRELDAARLDAILALDFPEGGGLWTALRDRLRRASARVMRVD